MTYAEAIEYLYTRTPLFQQHGGAAYKEGLHNTHLLDEHFLHPHTRYHTIHVGGTNGKGSCAHTLASILQESGYRVGLYTSPHLTDFRERIRVQGEKIPKERVVRFVEEERTFFEPLHPSFFEVTTALAFLYFAEQHVDVAVIEVGLGGRLDCTNIISPLLALITNISLDHTAQLGNTLPQIAREKAGIIKPGIPIVIGQATAEVRDIFIQTAQHLHAPIYFAANQPDAGPSRVSTPLIGPGQEDNTRTVLAALPLLQASLTHINASAVQRGFANVLRNTHLRGRWQQLAHSPLTLCDIAHNPGGWIPLFQRLQQLQRTHLQAIHPGTTGKQHNGTATLRLVFGVCADKDATAAVQLMPSHTVLYATQASTQRALPATTLQRLATEAHIPTRAFDTVAQAYHAAKTDATPDEIIFVGGSNFVVADLLALFSNDE